VKWLSTPRLIRKLPDRVEGKTSIVKKYWLVITKGSSEFTVESNLSVERLADGRSFWPKSLPSFLDPQLNWR
jgi:hypothetical protein